MSCKLLVLEKQDFLIGYMKPGTLVDPENMTLS